MNNSLFNLYQQRVIAGELRADQAQQEAISVLQILADALHNYALKSKHWLKWFWQKQQPVKGVYLYGDVGRGKTMLMDLFYESVQIAKKRRVHFHQFMLEVHDRLHQFNSGTKSADNAIHRLARDIRLDASLLCFDEFHISNIADAMILGRLFQALLDEGVVVFLTSNWPPDLLYKDGLQRDRFLPFIDVIKQSLEIYHLSGLVDHRVERWRNQTHYFTPNDGKAESALKMVFNALTDQAYPQQQILPVQGRALSVDRTGKGVAWMNFVELCEQPLGAADYLAIAYCFHTLIIENVPALSAQQRDVTLRFMTLIDALYESKVQVYISAEVPPERLCAPDNSHHFAFQRTISRLIEMQSDDYHHLEHLIG